MPLQSVKWTYMQKLRYQQHIKSQDVASDQQRYEVHSRVVLCHRQLSLVANMYLHLNVLMSV